MRQSVRMAARDAILIRLGNHLRRAREEKGLSQEELARQAGVHRTYVGGVERGEYNVTLLTLKRFTDTLGMSLEDAVRGLVKGRKKK